MRKFSALLRKVITKGDMILLALCMIATIFGIVMIYAVTENEGNTRYLLVQTGTMFAGALLYLAISAVDIDILAGQRTLMFLFNALILLMLIPFGIEGETGNKSWISLPFLPFNIQPAELCKITYIIILAKTMSVNQTRISSFRNVLSMTFHMLFLVGMIIVLSRDTGVALIFVFIFLAMAYVGGVNIWWFLVGFGAIAIAAPILWQYLIRGDQRERIMVLFDETIDPNGWGVRYQSLQNFKALRGGGLTGLGLFEGKYSESTLPAKHTDAIFSATGEQLGMIGCLFILLIMLAIVGRVIYIGMKSPDYMNRLICMGIASMLLFQIMINVGVCLNVLPVIGLALPFISYGGSSIMTSFLAMGFVSGIKIRPAPDISAHYIRPY